MTLAPRQTISPTPYAAFAAKPWTIAGSNVAYTGGNVGIDTPDPEAALHAHYGSAGAVTANDNSVLVAESSSQSYLSLLSPDSLERGILFGGPLFHSDGGIIYNNVATSRGLQFRTGGNMTRMTLDSAGLLGINTITPTRRLDVVETSAANLTFPLRITNAGDTVGTAVGMIWQSDAGGDRGKGAIVYERTTTWNRGDFRILQNTAANASVVGLADAVVTVKNSGLVGLGRDPTTNRLEVEGDASKTTTGSWLANSDRRIKTGLKRLENALEIIDQLRPVQFHYTEDYRRRHGIEDITYYNFVAQDYEQLSPEFVKDSREDGLLQIDTYPAAIYAVAALQELHHMVKHKDERITSLERQIAWQAAQEETQAEEIRRQRQEIESLQSKIRSLKEIERRLAHLEANVRQSATVQVALKEGAE